LKSDNWTFGPFEKNSTIKVLTTLFSTASIAARQGTAKWGDQGDGTYRKIIAAI